MRIGLLGAYSIDNTGDILLGYAVRQTLHKWLPGAELLTYAPVLDGDFWGHRWDRERGVDTEVVPVPPDGSMSWTRGLDALIVGGGGLIVPAPGFAPFLLGDVRQKNPRLPTAWNGLCSQNTPWYVQDLEPDYRAVKLACQHLRYVSVRNHTTERFLRRCGYEGGLEVVPDPALLLHVPSQPEAEARLDAELEALGIESGRPIIGISVGRAVKDGRAAAFFRELFALLRAHLESVDRDAQLLLFPFGELYGDSALQEAAHAALPEARVLRRRLSALDTYRLVGRLSAYLCTRFHAMLAAFAQDTPFLVMDEYLDDSVGSSKIREFIADLGLEPFYLCPYLSTEPGWKLRGLLAKGRTVSYKRGLGECQARLDRHYGAMLQALRLMG